jgi:hypothetical protein
MLLRIFNLSVLFAAVLFSGCAVMPHEDARQQFLNGNPQAAISMLEARDNQSRRNALLTRMEKGLIYHTQGEYKKSTEELLHAVKIMRDQDYISLSEQAKMLVINDWMGSYKGEYSERLWVHTYQMMNFLLLDEYQSAAVEARQALQVLEKYSKPLSDAWFTQALIALSFESVGKINDAYIEYKKLANKFPQDELMAKRVFWQARNLGLKSNQKISSDKISDHPKSYSGEKRGELVLFIADGLIQQKISGDIYAPPDFRVSFPVYPHRYSEIPKFNVSTDTNDQPFEAISTQLDNVVSASLDARGKAVLIKEIARIGVKTAIYKELKEEDETVARLVGALFFLLEEADTRGWGTLPESLTMLRIPLPEGTHNVVVNAGDGSLNKIYSIDNLNIKDGQRIYRKIRR